MNKKMIQITDAYSKEIGNVFDEIEKTRKEINRRLSMLSAIIIVAIIVTTTLVVSN